MYEGIDNINRHRYIGQLPGTNSFFVLLIVRERTDGQLRVSFLRRLLIKITLCVLSKYVQKSVFDSLGGKREFCLRAGSTQRRPVLPSHAPRSLSAVRRPDPPSPWCVRVLDSTGRIVLVRASKGTNRKLFFYGRLGSKRVCFLLD